MLQIIDEGKAPITLEDISDHSLFTSDFFLVMVDIEHTYIVVLQRNGSLALVDYLKTG